jgi:small subunit ribosomal protein S6
VQEWGDACAAQAYRYIARLPLPVPAAFGLGRLDPAGVFAPGHHSRKGTNSMPLYENVFIARQDISGAQVDQLADTFTQLIADQGGEIKKREYWGLRNLAYRMNKNRKGHYVLFNIDAPAPAIAELERTMRINEDVLRYLTLRVDSHEEGPSPVMQSRGSREDRPRRDRDRYGEGRDGDRGDRGDRTERPTAETPAAAPEPAGEKVEA